MTRERPARPATILFVDDDEILLDLMRRLLTFGGHKPLIAASGAAAERLVQERGAEIDLAILDLKMPELNGLELMGRLRASQPRLKVLLVTGYSPQAIYERYGIPDSQILRKPFDMTAVLNKIREVLDSPGEESA
jgi:DNA-binding NtrC family response regulator